MVPSRTARSGGDRVGTRTADHVEDWRAIEQRWREHWEREGTYRTPARSPDRPKLYCLDFFPYPSGDGLSVGHCRNYVPTDVVARQARMRGVDVLHPMGWDAFGLPAENEAIVRGRHPHETVPRYAATYRRQMTLVGCSYDWDRELSSADPSYYRWTQWLFLLLHRRGLAYRAEGWQWWCPRCRSVLANEQVVGGRCWRHEDTRVEKRRLAQWFVRTTAYADRLLRDLDRLRWPAPVVAMQRHWIGRTEGVEVVFRAGAHAIAAFTTRADTLFGATFVALAPEHPLAEAVAAPGRRAAVAAYVAAAVAQREIDRARADRRPTGVFTGAAARHPLTGEMLPVYVADRVVAHHGTGAVMGVPAHDARDLAFARRLGLPVRAAVRPADGDAALPFAGDGVLAGSGAFTGMSSAAAREAIADALEAAGEGRRAVHYRLRDWLVSRQRYWGAPIPIVHCGACGIVPVPEADLPVLLPHLERYEPAGDGRSPLAAAPEFVRTTCPRCGGPAERETDTLDTFVDSSWYYLRFASPHVGDRPFDRDAVRAWCPVDTYVGGREHAVLHLLYARFVTKVLADAGLVEFDEPFAVLRNQGQMRSPADGRRMSKSRGNVVTPDEVVARWGADALRIAVLSIGPFDQDAVWSEDGVAAAARFARRLFGLLTRAAGPAAAPDDPGAPAAARAVLARAARDVERGIERFRFNTTISRLIEAVHALEDLEPRPAGTPGWREAMTTLARIVAPLVPFLAEEAWRRLGRGGSVHRQAWPAFDDAPDAPREVTLIVQVNGRVRDRITAPAGISAARARALALRSERILRFLGGREITDVVVVPDRLVNVVAR